MYNKTIISFCDIRNNQGLTKCYQPQPSASIIVYNRESLGQTSGEYSIYQQNLGRSGNSEIPDRLGFSRHMKTGLN